MLHEILFALLGLTGSIVIEVPDESSLSQGLDQLDNSDESQDDLIRPSQFIVNPDLRFLSLAERDQINKIVQLGALFK